MRHRGASITNLLRGHAGELICSCCHGLIARAQMRPLGGIRVYDPDGGRIAPLGGVTAMAIAQTRLAHAEAASAGATGSDRDADGEVGVAQSHVEYLRREAGELVFDLICPNCRSHYLRSSPDLARSVQHEQGGRVSLA
ncbi:MAG: hypothetical protein M3Y91_02185 [Actinomycetota bacterium]|nr:hypothetical protein [Actinomycetota bacterium]